MSCLNIINKLNGVDDFDSEIEYTTECNGDLGCNATKYFLCYQAEHL